MPEPPQSVRYHSLDALRAAAMLLGIVFHATVSFFIIDTTWPALDDSRSLFLSCVMLFTHAFRMPVFFLIAGFFAHLVYLRRGPGGFFRHRAARIGLPFAVGWPILFTLVTLVYTYGKLKFNSGGDGTALWSATLTAMREDVGRFPRVSLTHLWFLYYLMLYYALALIGRAIGERALDRRGALREKVDGAFRRLLRSNWRVPLLALPLALLMWRMRDLSIDTPNTGPHPGRRMLAFYGMFFYFGWLLYRQADLLEEMKRHWRLYFVIALVLLVPKLILQFNFGGNVKHPHFAWIKLVHGGFAALLIWLMVFACHGFFLQFWSRPSALPRYIADSSYWLYLAHFPLVVWLQIELAHWPGGWLVKFPLICIVTLALLLPSYHYLIRSTVVGQMLNGRRYPRESFWRALGGRQS